MRRQAGKRIDVTPDVGKELRAPGTHRDDIHQQVAPVLATVQQVRAQRRRATEVMRDYAWALQIPVR